MKILCNCHLSAPTWPVFREDLHLSSCEHYATEQGAKLIQHFERAKELEAAGRRDKGLDVVFRETDKVLRSDGFAFVDAALNQADVSKYSTNLLVGILVATFPAEEKLQYRAEFFDRVKNHIQHPQKEKLLAGLKYHQKKGDQAE